MKIKEKGAFYLQLQCSCIILIFQQFVADISFLQAINWPKIVQLFGHDISYFLCKLHLPCKLSHRYLFSFQIFSAITVIRMFSLHNTMGCFILAILELTTTSETKQRHQRSPPTTPPRIVPFQFRDDLTVGSRTRITCEAAEGDLPLSFQWWHPTFEDLGDAPNTKIISVDDFSSTVSISSLTLNHTGEFTCSVTNSAGQVNYTAPLTVNCKCDAPDIVRTGRKII